MTILTIGQPVQHFVEQHGFAYLAEDDVSMNASKVFFWVEAFEPNGVPTPEAVPVSPQMAITRWSGAQ